MILWNPGGLSALKADVVLGVMAGEDNLPSCIVMPETHLAQTQFLHMKKALDNSHKGSRRLNILASKGVSPSDASAGTMVVSQLPLTSLPSYDSASLTIASRLQIFYFFIQPHVPWRGAVLYGIPRGCNHPNADSFTEVILEAWLLDQEQEHL